MFDKMVFDPSLYESNSNFDFSFQICKEEQENQAKLIEKEVKAAVAKVTASYEERLSSIRAENSLKIQQGKSLLIRNLVVSSVSFF